MVPYDPVAQRTRRPGHRSAPGDSDSSDDDLLHGHRAAPLRTLPLTTVLAMGTYLSTSRYHSNITDIMNGVNLLLISSPSRKIPKPLTLAMATVDQTFPFDAGFEPFASALGNVDNCHGALYSLFTKIMGISVALFHVSD